MVAHVTVNGLMGECQHSAIHIEMRDVYGTDDLLLEEWRQGVRHDPADRASWWRVWHDLVSQAVSRGARIRRARIVSEPISEYIRFEYDITYQNLVAGEDVRWLPRRHATDIALPGNDFWLFDNKTLLVSHFAGNGDWVGAEILDDSSVTALCAAAFDTVWKRAIPHGEYVPQRS